MKTNKLFGKMYFEALRQSRAIGLSALLVMTFGAIASTIGSAITARGSCEVVEKSIITFGTINPLAGILTYIIAPVMALFLFSFLNRRSGSDFYHSATQTRTSLYFSFTLAAVTWLVLAALVSTGAGRLCAAFFPDCFIVNNYEVLIVMTNRIISSLYVFSAALMAMTLTGTILSNILVTGMIIFVPRVMINLIAKALTAALPVLPGMQYLGLLNFRYNLIFGELATLFGYQSSITDIYCGLYTAAVFVCFTAVAYLAFRLRRSESAGQSAPNRFMQAVYRIIATTAVSAVASVFLFNYFTSGESATSEDIFTVCIIYLIALIVWFIYELVTTRKASNLIRTIPSLSVVVLLNIAIVIGMLGIYNGVSRFSPAAEDITGVRLLTDADNSTYNLGEYLLLDSSDIVLDDRDTAKAVSTSLSDSLKLGDNVFYNQTSRTRCLVAIKTSGGEYIRRISMPVKSYGELTSALNKKMEGESLFRELPSPESVEDVYSFAISDEDNRRLYREFCDYTKDFSSSDWADYISAAEKNSIADVYVSYTEGTRSFSLCIPISADIEKCAVIVLSGTKDRTPDRDIIIDALNGKYTIETLTLTYINCEEPLVLDEQWDKAKFSEAADDIIAAKDTHPTADKPYVHVYISYIDTNGSGKDSDYYFYGSADYFFALPDGVLPEALK